MAGLSHYQVVAAEGKRIRYAGGETGYLEQGHKQFNRSTAPVKRKAADHLSVHLLDSGGASGNACMLSSLALLTRASREQLRRQLICSVRTGFREQPSALVTVVWYTYSW